MNPIVAAVGRSASHTFGKPLQPTIRLTAGQGVDGDAHRGTTVKHRSRLARDPTQPNLRQVHLIHAELHEELRALGSTRPPGRGRYRAAPIDEEACFLGCCRYIELNPGQ